MGWFTFSLILLMISVGWFSHDVSKEKISLWSLIPYILMYISVIGVSYFSVNGLYEKSCTINNTEYRIEGSKYDNIYFRMVKINTQDTILYNPNTKHVIKLNSYEETGNCN